MARSHIIIIASLCLLITVGGVALYYDLAVRGEPLDIENSPLSCQLTFCVTGEVESPGIYTLDACDLTIQDAIEAAGGFTDDADTDWINPAAPLSDGDIIRVYRLGDAPQRVNINTADVWLLMALPQIGEVRAQAIVDYRNDNGPFQSIEELLNVTGIGTATYDEIKELVTAE